MVEYCCKLEKRVEFGSPGICNRCITIDCTNPIYEITVDSIPFGQIKEKLWSDKHLSEITIENCWCVSSCEGFRERIQKLFI